MIRIETPRVSDVRFELFVPGFFKYGPLGVASCQVDARPITGLLVCVMSSGSLDIVFPQWGDANGPIGPWYPDLSHAAQRAITRSVKRHVERLARKGGHVP